MLREALAAVRWLNVGDLVADEKEPERIQERIRRGRMGAIKSSRGWRLFG
jgi:hypothetical protein